MALDATVGGVNSNSYVTVEEANAYFENRTYASLWEELEGKDTFLITASSQLDWFITWKGYRTYEDQAMDWPRTGVIGRTGAVYPEDEIPPEIKIAVYEMTLSSLSVDRTADQNLDGLAEVRAGSLMLKTDNSLYSKKFDTIPDKIRRILSDVTTSGGIGVVRLMRA